MKLLTKEIERRLPRLGATESVPCEDKIVVCKFFTPSSNWTWYVVEGEYMKDVNTWEFFGLVDGLEKEWGYFTLVDLESVKGPLGLGVERDMYFERVPISQVRALKAVS